MYEKLKQAIQDQMYTVTEAVNLLNAFLQTGQITAEQFEELFNMAKDLPVNGDEENDQIEQDDKEKEWKEYKEKVDILWEKYLSDGGEEPEPPETPDGSKEHPIPATNNMQYYKDKYYTYDEILYLCTRDTEQVVWHTPD